MEVYVNTPLSVCEMRDPKDLYKKARAGKIHGFTGIDDPYEPPLQAEIVCNTDRESTRESSSKVVTSVLNYLSSKSS
jgi:adenylylsulfate kinase